MKKIVKYCLAGGMLALCGCAEIEKTTQEEYISMICGWEEPAELASVPVMHWQSKCDYKIICSNQEFVSFKIESWSYTGGAHGMTVTKVGTVSNGKVLKLADLPDDIPALWRKAIVKHFKAKSFDALVKERTVFKPYITENFYLDENGIHFIYDPYEIDCFAAGTIDIFVPYKLYNL